MLHIIHNLTHVWPKAIRDIVLNNWLLNPTGNPNSFVEVDLAQEHLNFWTKNFYMAHGSNSSWDWLELVGPCVNALRHLARNLHSSLGADQGTLHRPPNLANDILTLIESLNEHKVYQLQKGRRLDSDDPPVKDIISIGLQNLTDSTKNPLFEYNNAFTRLQKRRCMKPIVVPPSTNGNASPISVAPSSRLGAHQSNSPPAPITTPTISEGSGVKNGGAEVSEEPDINSERSELLCILDELVNGEVEPTLARDTADDVSLDMDLVELVEDTESEFPADFEDDEPVGEGE
ncbi:hypothetical protein BD779DRAFT_1682379 [Infundibulicybe gibba]|nr:hypothetical protein BD779DRAFT_1682379 [Infundibulicybe gibba]